MLLGQVLPGLSFIWRLMDRFQIRCQGFPVFIQNIPSVCSLPDDNTALICCFRKGNCNDFFNLSQTICTEKQEIFTPRFFSSLRADSQFAIKPCCLPVYVYTRSATRHYRNVPIFRIQDISLFSIPSFP